eukprot:15019573-Alexandrium_andersonii.AAC.1
MQRHGAAPSGPRPSAMSALPYICTLTTHTDLNCTPGARPGRIARCRPGRILRCRPGRHCTHAVGGARST